MPRFHASLDAPVGPPPEVLAQIDAAWERAQELFTTDLELHFEVDRSWGRVWAELRNPDGSVAETLSALEAIAMACGDPAATFSLTA
jgi:hypothetical protein